MGVKNGALAQEAVGRDSIQLQTKEAYWLYQLPGSGLRSVEVGHWPVSTHQQKSRGIQTLTNNLKALTTRRVPLLYVLSGSGRRLSIVPSYSTQALSPCSDTDLGLPWQSSG